MLTALQTMNFGFEVLMVMRQHHLVVLRRDLTREWDRVVEALTLAVRSLLLTLLQHIKSADSILTWHVLTPVLSCPLQQ